MSPTTSPTASPITSPTTSLTVNPTISPTVSPTTSPTISPTVTQTDITAQHCHNTANSDHPDHQSRNLDQSDRHHRHSDHPDHQNRDLDHSDRHHRHGDHPDHSKCNLDHSDRHRRRGDHTDHSKVDVEPAPNAVTIDEPAADFAAGPLRISSLSAMRIPSPNFVNHEVRIGETTPQHQPRRPSTLMHVLHVHQGGAE